MKHENRFNDPRSNILDLTQQNSTPDMITLLHQFYAVDSDFFKEAEPSPENRYSTKSDGETFLQLSLHKYSIPKLCSLVATADHLCFKDRKKQYFLHRLTTEKMLALCSNNRFQKAFLAGEKKATEAIDFLNTHLYLGENFLEEFFFKRFLCIEENEPIRNNHIDSKLGFSLEPIDAMPEIPDVELEDVNYSASWSPENPETIVLKDGEEGLYTCPFPSEYSSLRKQLLSFVKVLPYQSKFALPYLEGTSFKIALWDITNPQKTPLIFTITNTLIGNFNCNSSFSQDGEYHVVSMTNNHRHTFYIYCIKTEFCLYVGYENTDRFTAIKKLLLYHDYENNELSLFIEGENTTGEPCCFTTKVPATERSEEQYFLYCLSRFRYVEDPVPVDSRFRSYLEQCKKLLDKSENLEKFYIHN